MAAQPFKHFFERTFACVKLEISTARCQQSPSHQYIEVFESIFSIEAWL